MLTERNAIIESSRLTTEHGLTVCLVLDYGGLTQAFGGYILYTPAFPQYGNIAGHFIWRTMEVAGVEDWSKLVGKSIRVRLCGEDIIAIGHITKDIWFNPREEFDAMQSTTKKKMKRGVQ